MINRFRILHIMADDGLDLITVDIHQHSGIRVFIENEYTKGFLTPDHANQLSRALSRAVMSNNDAQQLFKNAHDESNELESELFTNLETLFITHELNTEDTCDELVEEWHGKAESNG
jgi:hypothetical protein